MRAYFDVLDASERADRVHVRPLVVYHTQSHVGQRVTQLGAALVRSRACGGRSRGIATLDERREDLELLAATLERRFTIGRLTAAVSVVVAVYGIVSQQNQWLRQHAWLVTDTVVAIAVIVVLTDLVGTWCFGQKRRLFVTTGTYAIEDEMHDVGFLPQGHESAVAAHLFLWDVGAIAAAGLAVHVRPHWGWPVLIAAGVLAVWHVVVLASGETATRRARRRR